MTKWEQEQKVGAIHRGITHDVRNEFNRIRKRFFSSKYEGNGNYMDSAYEFDDFIERFFSDDELKALLGMHVEQAIKRKLDLWKCSHWIKTMRKLCMVQYSRRMDEIGSAVVKLANMDITGKPKGHSKDTWDGV